VMDEHDQRAIEMFLNQTDPTGQNRFWIGLTDLAHEGHWVWMSSGRVAEYTNWKNHDNHNTTEHFVQILNAAEGRLWNDCPNQSGISVCTKPFHGLCQFVLE
jgi:hypothetical protein